MKVALLVILFLIFGGLYFYQNFNFTEGPDESSQILRVGEVSLYAPDQRPGNSVNISVASLTKPGYIVIHEDDRGGVGKILGNSFILPPEESKGIFIGLVRPSIDGEVLFAVIYEDSGDGIFTPEIDVPFKDDAGNVIFMRFKIDRQASSPAGEINF